jgi:hypothetical protein
MRFFLALSLSIALCGSANAAKLHHAKLRAENPRAAHSVVTPKGFAVPGWTEEQTRYWLNSFHGGTD